MPPASLIRMAKENNGRISESVHLFTSRHSGTLDSVPSDFMQKLGLRNCSSMNIRATVTTE